MPTVHINVPNHSDISGSFPLPLSVTGGSSYKCPLGAFPLIPSVSTTGSGNTLTITGSFTITGVGDNYGQVTFTGTYVLNGGKGSGSVTWSGTHQSIEDGTDTWTSDTTTPEPEETDALAEKGAHNKTRHAGAGRKA
jgi:hypothetical protein